MIDAYLDNGKIVPTAEIHAICDSLATTPEDFDLVPLFKSYGTKGIGRECRLCGAPLGSVDPDTCAYVMLGTCSDCREP